jgi:hypothetical protein
MAACGTGLSIGAKIKAGQLLADMETPEIDQELRQAERAASKPQRTSTSAVTLTRWRDLLRRTSSQAGVR